MKTKRKIYLSKTADSRTRKKKVIADVTKLQSKLSSQYNDFTTYLLKKGYSSTTTAQHITEANRFLQWIEQQNIDEVETILYNDVLGYVQSLSGVKNRTKDLYLRGVKQYFNFLISQNIITENPAEHVHLHGIKRKTLYSILNRQELDKLYNDYQIPDEANDKNKNQNWFKQSVIASKRNKIILGLMVYQGMNTLELSRLATNDIKLREGKIFIEGSRRSNERELKLEAHQVLDIMEYQLKVREQLLQLNSKETDLFFVSAGTSERFNNVISKLMDKLQQLNKKVTSTKQIRASVITHWLKLYNLREVQYMAGHRFVSSTEGYLINDLDDLQEEITKYHPIS
jgi:site-specific recombinase XerD